MFPTRWRSHIGKRSTLVKEASKLCTARECLRIGLGIFLDLNPSNDLSAYEDDLDHRSSSMLPPLGAHRIDKKGNCPSFIPHLHYEDTDDRLLE